MIIPKTEKKMMKVIISGKLLERISLESEKKGYDPLYYTRLILSRHFKVSIHDKSVQSGKYYKIK